MVLDVLQVNNLPIWFILSSLNHLTVGYREDATASQYLCIFLPTKEITLHGLGAVIRRYQEINTG